MHDAAFADAARPAPGAILKLSLRPYSLGHELLLQRERNVLAHGHHEFPRDERARLVESRRALLEAVLICCQSWHDNLRMNSDPFIALKIKIWSWRLRGVDFERAAEDFQNYRAAGSTWPRLTPHAGNEEICRQAGAPMLARLYRFLLERIPGGERLQYGGSAWDFPLGLAQWLYCVHLESEERIKIENEIERDVRLMDEEARAEASLARSTLNAQRSTAGGKNA